jgi:hypothetical protein
VKIPIATRALPPTAAASIFAPLLLLRVIVLSFTQSGATPRDTALDTTKPLVSAQQSWWTLEKPGISRR